MTCISLIFVALCLAPARRPPPPPHVDTAYEECLDEHDDPDDDEGLCEHERD